MTRRRLPAAGPARRRRRAVALACLAGLAAGAPPATAQQPGDGERLYGARCAACHGATPAQARIGPPLAGVVGRLAGSVEGARYSAALRDSGIVWDAPTLDAYLADPRRRVPGTTMTVAVRNADDRAAIVAYLASLDTANQ